MRTSEQVHRQIWWDPRLDPARFTLGVDVHAAERAVVPLPDFVPGGDIPWHRVVWIAFDGALCWDRATGLDTVDALARSGVAARRALGPPRWAPRVPVRWADGAWRAVADEPVGEPRPLRVLTWNVLWDRFDADAVRSEERWPRLLDRALDTGADVIALQEVVPRFHALVLADPRIRAAWWVSHPPDHADIGRTDLLMLGRPPVREIGWLELGPHKAALAASLGDEGPVLITTHLTSDHSRGAVATRKRELDRVRDAVLALDRPAVVLGDLNLPDEAPVDGFVDAWTALREPEPTFDPPNNVLAALCSRTGQAARLDRVLLAGQVRAQRIDRIGVEAVEGLPLSDHYGLCADLRFDVDPVRFVGPVTPRSALAWLPPEPALSALQAIRSVYDPRGAARWPPHVNVVWGFVREADLDAAAPALHAAAAGAAPFDTRLGTVGRFDHTHHLRPDEPAPWIALRRSFARHMPADPGPFEPHLTVARGEAAPDELPTVAAPVEQLAVLTRRGDGPFEVRGWVPLGGAAVRVIPEAPWPVGAPADEAPIVAALHQVTPISVVGSVALGVAIDGSDLDVLALVPDAEIPTLGARLAESTGAVSVVEVRKAGLPGLRLRVGDRAVDVVVVPTGALGEVAARALSAVGDVQALLDAVGDRAPAFRQLTRWVKGWARAQALDDAALGGVEGLAWAVLAAHGIAAGDDPQPHAFIRRWAAWDWRRGVGGPDDPTLDVCVHTPSAPIRPITLRADRRRLEGALVAAWEAVEAGASAEDLLRPPPWHRTHAEAVVVTGDDDAAMGLARGRAMRLLRALGPLALGPRRFAGGFALGLARDADPAEVDAQVAAWAEGMRGVTAARRGTDEVP